MSKTLKKVLVFIIALVVVLAVIFLIEILLPRNQTNITSPSPTPVTSSASPSTVPSGAPSASPSASPSPTDEGSVTTEETADGTKYNVTVPGSFISYSVTADKAAFTHARKDGGELFTSVKDAKEFLEISFIQGTKGADLAPRFLNSYIKYKEFEQSGEDYIDGTKITGETVTANDGTIEMTAWLVDTDNGVLAVVISCTMADQAAETAQLDKILATLTVVQP